MRVFFFVALTAIALQACQTKESDDVEISLGENIISYSTHFELIKENQNYKLHILSPDSGEITDRYLFSKKKNTAINGYKTIQYPLKKIIPLSSTVIGMLSVLNKTDVVVGISNHNYLYDPQIANRFEQGKIIECGDEATMPLEKIAITHPDIILYSGFGEDFPSKSQLHKMGIYTLPIYDWRELHPLGKAEWIKLIGILTDNLLEAEKYFIEIENEYNSLKNSLPHSKESSAVLCGSLLGDIWYAPNGESYVAQLLKDAQANYIYKSIKGTGSLALSFEEILYDSREAEIWINPGSPTFEAIFNTNPKAKLLTPIKKKAVYCYSHEMNKFWERSVIMPHLVLKDFINIVHNNGGHADSLYFYAKVSD